MSYRTRFQSLSRASAIVIRSTEYGVLNITFLDLGSLQRYQHHNPKELTDVRLHNYRTVYKAHNHVELHLSVYKLYDPITRTLVN